MQEGLLASSRRLLLWPASTPRGDWHHFWSAQTSIGCLASLGALHIFLAYYPIRLQLPVDSRYPHARYSRSWYFAGIGIQSVSISIGKSLALQHCSLSLSFVTYRVQHQNTFGTGKYVTHFSHLQSLIKSGCEVLQNFIEFGGYSLPVLRDRLRNQRGSEIN